MARINFNLFTTNKFSDRNNHRFYVKTTTFDDLSVYWEYSCGCIICVPVRVSNLSLIQMRNKFETAFVDIPEDCWPKNHLETDHFCCPKDQKLLERLSFIWEIEQEEFYPQEESAAEILEMIACVCDPAVFEKIIASYTPTSLRAIFSQPATADQLKRRFKNPKKLSEICEKTYRQAKMKRTYLTMARYCEYMDELTDHCDQPRKKQRT